jgi:hypothetical protein
MIVTRGSDLQDFRNDADCPAGAMRAGPVLEGG